ncbi:MAG: TPR end-of-group domain-containing protein [Candidatus Aminicenantes bacterium]
MAGEKSKNKRNDYQKALTAYQQAMKAFRKRDYEKTADFLKAFMEKYASEGELMDRAQIYLSICEEKKKTEEIQLKTFDDYYYQGIYKVNQGEYKEALKLLEKAHQMKPKEGKILYLMADAYCRMGKKDRCLEHLKKAIHLDKYFSILAQNERDFEDIREDKKFKLITRMT